MLNTVEPSRPQRKPNLFYNSRGLRAGWRLLIFAAMLVAIAFAVGQVLKLAGAHRGGSLPRGFLFPVALGVGDLGTFLIVLFVCWVMSKIERQPVGSYGLPLQRSAFSRFWTGCVFWGFIPLSILLLIMRALHVFYFGNLVLHGGQILIWAGLWGFTFLMVGFFEEFLFRGYALHTLADGLGFWPAAIIMAIIFARAHMGNKGETIVGVIATSVFALFAAATLRRTGDLWLAVGAHAGWDWGQTFFYGVNDSGLNAPGHLFNSHPAGQPWLSGGSVGPEGSALALALWAVLFVVFLLLYRKRHVEPAPLVPETAPAAGPLHET